jgi:hypothetical protein
MCDRTWIISHKETVTVQTLRTLVVGMTLLTSTLMLQQPVAAQSTSNIPFGAHLVPAPNCSTSTSFVLINTNRSLQIGIVGLKCDGRLVTGSVTIKALQVRLVDGVIFEIGSVSTPVVRGNGAVALPAGGGALLGNCGIGDPGSFGTTCQSLIIAVQDKNTGAVKEATGVQ